MKIVTTAEMREIDRASSERFGIPSLTLMENAGSAVASFVLARFPAVKKIGVVCGKGNNGGDGFVVARKMQAAGKEAIVLLLAGPEELRGDAAEMFSQLPQSPTVARSSEELQHGPGRAAFGCDLLVDAILGSGFRPPVSGLYAEAIQLMNGSGRPVVAVDIPSGADAEAWGEQNGTIARADAVVTFTAPRPAHIFGGLTGGPMVITPIGSPDEAIVSGLQLELITPRDIVSLFRARPRDSNKGRFGHVLVVGGSLGKAGAAAMAGMSALRVGAGLATVATAKSSLPTVAGFHPELMTEPLEETDAGTISMQALKTGKLEALAEGKTVLAIGPGISRNRETAELVRAIVGKYRAPMVLDADGLNAFEGRAHELKGGERSLVITPHPGEMARLTGLTVGEVQKDRINVARKFAREHGVTVVLKGNRTLVADPTGEIWVNTTGNPGMATGGTGDILTGMTAGLMAQSGGQFAQAVWGAVYIHGLAGDVAEESLGEQSLIATDLLPMLPEALRRVRRDSAKAAVEIHA